MKHYLFSLILFFSMTSNAMTLECESKKLNGKKGNPFMIQINANSHAFYEAEIIEKNLVARTKTVSNATDVYFINDRLIITASAETVDWTLTENQSECFVTTDIPHINLKENFFGADYTGTVTFYQDIQANPSKLGCSLSSVQSNRKSEFLSCMIYDDE